MLVLAGVYRENPVIGKYVVLRGEPGATIDGGGQGVVLTVRARCTISGFIIRGSGANQSEEHAGILAEQAESLVVEDNHFEDVLFGIYVKQSNSPIIRNNTIEGKDIPVPLRGDGIRLWYRETSNIISCTSSICFYTFPHFRRYTIVSFKVMDIINRMLSWFKNSYLHR